MTPSITQKIAEDVVAYDFDSMPEAAKTFAKHCILDWFAVTIAGAGEPLSQILAQEFGEQEGSNTLIGHRARASLLDSALVNGATSHALDYDDTVMSMMGHATVAIFPAVLALAEDMEPPGAEIITAFVAGFETACRIGLLAQPSHYTRGFHNTGTIGTLGAAAAASRLMGLNSQQTSHALGLAAAQAAGLKSSFGTMAKPLQAGKAAANGLLSARLAARGFTANTEALETAQGFLATQSDQDVKQMANIDPGHLIQENLFKYHAACYFTHSPIEALVSLCDAHGLTPETVDQITLHVADRQLSVCNIPEPQTGLEAKFSLRQCAAYVLHGLDTSSLDTFLDGLAQNSEIAKTRSGIKVVGGYPHPTESLVEVLTSSGNTISAKMDTGIPERDLENQESRLISKFVALTSPLLGDLFCEQFSSMVLTLENAEVCDLIALVDTT